MITNRKIIPLDNIMQFLSYKSNGIICWEQRNLLIVCFQTTPKNRKGIEFLQMEILIYLL